MSWCECKDCCGFMGVCCCVKSDYVCGEDSCCIGRGIDEEDCLCLMTNKERLNQFEAWHRMRIGDHEHGSACDPCWVIRRVLELEGAVELASRFITPRPPHEDDLRNRVIYTLEEVL